MAKRRKLRVIFWVVVIVAIGGGVGFYLLRRGEDQNQAKYRTEVVGKGDVTMVVTATGTISAVTTVQVGSQVSGIIAKLFVDFNSPVKKEQLLAELDPTPFQATVEQRKADLVQAQVQQRNNQITCDRQKRLLDENLVAQSDYDTAKANLDASKAQVEQAEAALKQAQTNLTYTRIVSPVDGVVVDRQYDVGQTVAASFQAPTLFTIAQDLTKMQVQADVDQSDIGRVKVGQPARFTVDAYPDETFQGKITQVRLNATVNQNVITYPVIIEVPNPDVKLRPKMTADITIEVAKVRDVLRIPNAALRFRPPQTEAEGAKDAGASPASGTTRTGGASPEQRAARTGSARGFAGAAAQFAGALPAGKSQKGMQTVYLVVGSNELKSVKVRTGITDGKYTEIAEGEVKPGDAVAVGIVTAKAETGNVPGMGRMFH